MCYQPINIPSSPITISAVAAGISTLSNMGMLFLNHNVTVELYLLNLAPPKIMPVMNKAMKIKDIFTYFSLPALSALTYHSKSVRNLTSRSVKVASLSAPVVSSNTSLTF